MCVCVCVYLHPFFLSSPFFPVLPASLPAIHRPLYRSFPLLLFCLLSPPSIPLFFFSSTFPKLPSLFLCTMGEIRRRKQGVLTATTQLHFLILRPVRVQDIREKLTSLSRKQLNEKLFKVLLRNYSRCSVWQPAPHVVLLVNIMHGFPRGPWILADEGKVISVSFVWSPFFLGTTNSPLKGVAFLVMNTHLGLILFSPRASHPTVEARSYILWINPRPETLGTGEEALWPGDFCWVFITL